MQTWISEGKENKPHNRVRVNSKKGVDGISKTPNGVKARSRLRMRHNEQARKNDFVPTTPKPFRFRTEERSILRKSQRLQAKETKTPVRSTGQETGEDNVSTPDWSKREVFQKTAAAMVRVARTPSRRLLRSAQHSYSITRSPALLESFLDDFEELEARIAREEVVKDEPLRSQSFAEEVEVPMAPDLVETVGNNTSDLELIEFLGNDAPCEEGSESLLRDGGRYCNIFEHNAAAVTILMDHFYPVPFMDDSTGDKGSFVAVSTPKTPRVVSNEGRSPVYELRKEPSAPTAPLNLILSNQDLDAALADSEFALSGLPHAPKVEEEKLLVQSADCCSGLETTSGQSGSVKSGLDSDRREVTTNLDPVDFEGMSGSVEDPLYVQHGVRTRSELDDLLRVSIANLTSVGLNF